LVKILWKDWGVQDYGNCFFFAIVLWDPADAQNLDITRQTTGNLANGFVKMGDGQIGATNF